MDFKGGGRKAGVVSLELMQPGTCPFPRIAQTSSLTHKLVIKSSRKHFHSEFTPYNSADSLCS